MPIRSTGINSGLDTDSIITELVKVQKTKVNTLKSAQTKLSWQQDTWKDLNTKIYNLYSKTIGNLKFSGSYSKKATTVSDSAVASVVTGADAVNGVQSLKVNSLAKAGYLTGAEMGSGITASSTMADLGMTADSSFKFKVGSGTEVEVTAKTTDTLSSVVDKMKAAGANVNFDASNHRLFVSSKETGESSDFSINTSADGNSSALISALGLAIDSAFTTPTDGDAMKAGTGSNAPTRVFGVNAEIVLNGATFESADNTFEVNGLTINALKESSAEVTVTTQDDYQGIYDMIKSFVKEYNTLINEMDSKYNSDSAEGYEPLTDDEKDAMSDTEVEKYEKKIKDALLRRDSTLGDVGTALKNSMQKGFTVNGETMYLSSFGIETLGYFTSADNEKNAYHIAGDASDSSSSGSADKLKSAITNDPSSVVSFFTQLAQNMYTTMTEKMSSTELRSVYKVYNDKQMKTEYTDYTKKIASQEEKVTDMEDRYYKQFSAMETALAKLTSNQNAISGLLG